ncbi:breast cancer type 2 susceptibility protein [Brachionichthys hirsutus]|uniref:breast cancer type 2 susceptibility protein n=1 Tax=Brachionichthys hirsutus TaxID=412623 RepID=UPI0036043239
MDLPSKNLYDTYKDEIWKELGPLDPDWFDALTTQAFSNEGNVSVQDDLCANEEGDVKTPLNKTAVDSQLFSTPKVFRHVGVVSPETEKEQPVAAERDLLHTPQKSPASYAKHISESLGAQNLADISWTSSLNTPLPIQSTLILTKDDERPRPCVQELFPTLSNAPRVGGVLPGNNNMPTPYRGAVPPVVDQNLESLDSPPRSLNHTDSVLKQKPDATEDGGIHATVASLLDGAEDVLSIFFTNSSSALRKVKTDRIKRRYIIAAKERSCSSMNVASTNGASSREQKTADREPATQWSPLSLSDIPPCTVDTFCYDNRFATQAVKNSLREQQHSDVEPVEEVRATMTPTLFTKKKRQFVYNVETSKRQIGGIPSHKVDSSSGILDSGQALNGGPLVKAPAEAECTTQKIERKQDGELTERYLPPAQAKVLNLDMSQLSRDFAQDFSQIPNPENVAKASVRKGFSPSACLSAVKRANQKTRQANICHNFEAVSTTEQNNLINDCGFQSSPAHTTQRTSSFHVRPISNTNNGKARLEDILQKDGNDVKPPSTIGENHTLDPEGRGVFYRESMASTQLPSRAKVPCRLPEKAAETPPASGFKTASNKGIHVTSANLERAKVLFEDVKGETTCADDPVVSSHGTTYDLAISHESVEVNLKQPLSATNKSVGNHCQLTASQKADVTELCTMLEEADSQFEFTQFKTVTQKHHCPAISTSPQNVDRELDPDLLIGIDFDDSFNSDAAKHTPAAVMREKVTYKASEATSKSSELSLKSAVKAENSSTEDLPSSKCIFEGISSVLSDQKETFDKAGDVESGKLEDKNPLIHGVGFKTAFRKCSRKARDVFADLSEDLLTSEKSPGKQNRETGAKTLQIQGTDNRDEGAPEGFNDCKRNTTGCPSGFLMASGRKISISAKAMQEADAFFDDCDQKGNDALMSVRESNRLCPLYGAVGQKKIHQTSESVEMNQSLCEGTAAEFDIVNARPAADHKEDCGNLCLSPKPFSSVDASKKTDFLLKDIRTLENTNEQVEEKGDDVRTGHLTGQIHASLPKCSGFQTASGKGVIISSTALNKAKTLLSGVNEDEKICVKSPPSKMPVPASPPRIGGLLAARGEAAFPSEASRKEDSPLGDSSVSAGVAAVSHTKDNDKKEEHAENMERTFSGFSTGQGAKVQVSRNHLLKAKNLLKGFDSSIACAEIEQTGSFFKGSDMMDCNDDVSVNQRKYLSAVNGSGSGQKHCSKTDDFSSVNDLSHGGAFCTAIGKKVSVSDDAIVKAKPLLNEGDTSQQLKRKADGSTGGFQTASGKGVTISSAALKKAKSLFSECEGAEVQVSGKQTHVKMPVPSLPQKSHGFSAASGKPVAISSESLKKAKALFGDISSRADIDLHTLNSEHKDAGFALAKKTLLDANNSLQYFDDGKWPDSDSSTSVDPPKSHPAKVNDAKRISQAKLTTSSDKDVTTEESAPREVKSFFSLQATDDEKESQPLRTHGGIPIKGNTPTDALKYFERKINPPFVVERCNSPGDEMSCALDLEINEANSSKGSKVNRTEESFPCFQSLNLRGCTETQQRFLAQEALDCTKALLEDEKGQRLSMAAENTSRLDDPNSDDSPTEEERGKGKRPVENADMSSQPPLKRRLLEEFDRTVEDRRGSALNPISSSPNDGVKDRSVFKYSVCLRPNITGPQRNVKNYLEVLPHTAPTQSSSPGDGKTAQSKMPTFVLPFFKSGQPESLKTTVFKESIRTGTFVPPFKNQRTMDKKSSCKPQEEDKLHHLGVNTLTNNYMPSTPKTQSPADLIGTKRKDKSQVVALTDPNNLMVDQYLPSCGSEDSAADGSCVMNTSKAQDMFKALLNIELARDMQDMRIRKKKRQIVRPLPGSLFLTKTSGVSSRIALKSATNGQPPARSTQKQLYSHGVHQHVCGITSETAESFRFSLHQFLKPEAFIDGGGVQLADGGWMIPTDDGTAGKAEFYRSLCDTPGVDPKLISEKWVFNHYRWIVWKQASMERSFPEMMGSLCLNPEQVLLQLKYRYDIEVDHSRRPALRKIMEKDDAAAKTLVLCVCGVASWGHSPQKHSFSDIKTPCSDAKVENTWAVVWVTDGWYTIKARLDEPLTAMLCKGRLAVGGKLIVHGAQLVGSQEACSPLEAPESLMLQICANGSRRTRWDCKMGFHRDPRPFLLPVSSLYGNGGPVGCVDIIILRSYPIQWMERKSDGGVVFRSARAEEKEARQFSNHRQRALEALFAKIQAEFEKEEKGNKEPRRSARRISRQEFTSLHEGDELHEAVGNDPSYFEAHLSEQQMESLRAYRHCLLEKRQAELQDRYRRALEAVEDGDAGFPRRDATPVWRLCMADSLGRPGSVYQLNIWRPPSDLQSLLKEGHRFKAYNLATSDGKKRGGSTSVQLTATKKTQFQELQASQEWLSGRFRPRVSTNFRELQNTDFQPLCGEVDLTGCIISIVDEHGFSPAVFLADMELNFVKVRCFSSLAQSGLEDVVKPRVFLALSNLQLRGQSTSPTPVVYAGDLTVFSSNPKEVHLQESLGQLKSLFQGRGSLFETAEAELSHLLKSGGQSANSSPAPQAQVTASTKDGRQDTKVTFHQSVRSLGSFTPVGRNPPAANGSTERDPSSQKRRRALDHLSRIPSPPPLSPLSSAASPCVKKVFIPPRRSGTPSTIKTARTLARKPVSAPVEDEWVNDEELALIDTQALIE